MEPNVKCLHGEICVHELEGYESTLCYCATKGHVNCLHAAYDSDRKYEPDVYICAAEAGQIECLKFMFSCHLPKPKYGKNMCVAAATSGKLDCLKWLHMRGCLLTNEVFQGAAFGGHIDCMIWLREQHCPWDARTCQLAAMAGHLNCLQWLHENGAPWDATTCSAAAAGQLECLKYAHNAGAPWDAETVFYAARFGYLESLQYAIENGCPTNLGVLGKICLNDEYCDCLQYLCEHDADLGNANDLWATAISNGYIKCLKILNKYGYKATESFVEAAVMYVRVDVLVYLLECGYPYDYDKIMKYDNTCSRKLKEYYTGEK